MKQDDCVSETVKSHTNNFDNKVVIYLHKIVKIFYNKKVKNGKVSIRFCGIKIKSFEEYKTDILKKIFLILLDLLKQVKLILISI